MVGGWGGVGLRKMIALIKKDLKNTCLAQISTGPEAGLTKKEQENKMNDVKLAVLGGEGTGKSGELCFSMAKRMRNIFM